MSISQQAHGAAQQYTMFDLPAFAVTARLAADLPPVPDIARREVLAWEKELIGAYISDHPLSRVWADLEQTITVLTGQIDETMAGQSVTVAGMVNYVRQIITKKGDPMAFAQIEDLQGTVELVIFPAHLGRDAGAVAAGAHPGGAGQGQLPRPRAEHHRRLGDQRDHRPVRPRDEAPAPAPPPAGARQDRCPHPRDAWPATTTWSRRSSGWARSTTCCRATPARIASASTWRTADRAASRSSSPTTPPATAWNWSKSCARCWARARSRVESEP